MPEGSTEKKQAQSLKKLTDAFENARIHNRAGRGENHEGATTVMDYATSKWRPRSSTRASSMVVISMNAVAWWIFVTCTLGWLIPGVNLMLVGYAAFIVYDNAASRTSGRPWEWFKRLRYWELLADYFPMRLHSAPPALDPAKKYIFGYHPHGVISLGAISCFATNGAHFLDRFPGIDLRLLTLKVNFYVPVLREVLLWLGVCDVSAGSIRHHLQRGPGSAVMIVVGGAAESLQAYTGEYELTLKNRKGFVKMALREGASLVPVFSFGETEVFHMRHLTASQGHLAALQARMKQLLGFTIPCFHGQQGLSWGLLPYQNPVHAVIGHPIDCPKTPEPTQELIDEYHAKYVDALIDVFNANKHSVGLTRTGELKIR